MARELAVIGQKSEGPFRLSVGCFTPRRFGAQRLLKSQTTEERLDQAALQKARALSDQSDEIGNGLVITD